MDWSEPILKPAEVAEKRLIDAIVSGEFAVGSHLPAERELARLLGVTRPTLREALQRLARDGWIDIQHGKPTRVRNYWEEGNLNVLSALAQDPARMPPDFVPNLLTVRNLLAPHYARQACRRDPQRVIALLQQLVGMPDSAESQAAADFRLHHTLCVASGNPAFTLILNGFAGSYVALAAIYFQTDGARARSRQFYTDLLAAFVAGDDNQVAALVERTMAESLAIWQRLQRLATAP